MKRKKILLSLCFGWLGFATSLSAQSTIAYFTGPTFAIPYETTASIDFDRDGFSDFEFANGGFICTQDIPTSGCSSSSYILALNTNGVLSQGSQAVIVPAGTEIGGTTSTNAAWKSLQAVTVSTSFFSPRYGTSGTGGPLASSPRGEGCLGIRFYIAGNLHYGWIHARMPNQAAGTNTVVLGFLPLIIDWAYETRPHTPIVTGALPIALLAAPRIVRTGNLRLNWQSEINKTYQLQFKEQLDAADWSNLDFAIIATATNSAVDVPTSGTARFYRVVRIE